MLIPLLYVAGQLVAGTYVAKRVAALLFTSEAIAGRMAMKRDRRRKRDQYLGYNPEEEKVLLQKEIHGDRFILRKMNGLPKATVDKYVRAKLAGLLKDKSGQHLVYEGVGWNLFDLDFKDHPILRTWTGWYLLTDREANVLRNMLAGIEARSILTENGELAAKIAKQNNMPVPALIAKFGGALNQGAIKPVWFRIVSRRRLRDAEFLMPQKLAVRKALTKEKIAAFDRATSGQVRKILRKAR